MVENGGAAFPQEHSITRKGADRGMSLRDYFACHVIEGMLLPERSPDISDARKAYQWADLLIQARQEELAP